MVEEKMAENFSDLGKEIDNQAQEAQRVPNKVNPKRPTSRQIVIKVSEVKDKATILKATRGKQVTYKVNAIRLSTDFSAAALKSRRE